MKIRIIGPCGRGKSTVCKELAQRYKIPGYELDNLVWDRSKENARYPVEVRDAKLREIVNQESWVVEGVHFKWGLESFEQADLIFIVRLNKYVRDFRVVRRFVRTRLGLEEWNYKQSLGNVCKMIFKWNAGYDKEDLHKIMELTRRFFGQEACRQEHGRDRAAS
ncbi:hypothetical protein LJK88_18420 [Paenibacillus sp. P26]|nr:hypothetical protein LJK88_18420 [Paenibacillus sp. P26]